MNQTAAIAINGFFEKAGADASFKNQIDNAKSPDEIVALAKTQGYEFSGEDFREFATLAKQQESGELSDDHLSAVAGGVVPVVIAAVPAVLSVVDFAGKRFGWWK